MQSLKFYIEHPKVLKLVLLEQISPLLTDKQYIRAKWRIEMGDRNLDLINPRTFNEKLQWLKLYDRKPIYTTMVDKFAVKQYVAERIGDEYVIPLLGVWDRVDDIVWDMLPNQFVIKCSHDSGGVVICKDKSRFDKDKAIKDLKKWMKTDYYWKSREWPYKNVKKRIFAEAYMEDSYGELRDYKWFCFNGEPKFMLLSADRMKTGSTKTDFFDAEYNHLPFTHGHPNQDCAIPKPDGFEKMKDLAAILSEGIPSVRVDFYDINGRVFFGEFTFFSSGGMCPFEPEEWDYTFGDWLKLPGRE